MAEGGSHTWFKAGMREFHSRIPKLLVAGYSTSAVNTISFTQLPDRVYGRGLLCC